MKATKKSKPETRGRPAKFVEKRPTIGARLQPAIYQQVIEAAAANRCSISMEIERRIEKSFERNPLSPDDELHDLAVRVIAAFEAGGRLENPQAPVGQWINDPLHYDRAVIAAFEALMARHPNPRYIDLLKLIYAVSKRLEQMLFNVSDEDKAGLRLPTLVMTFPATNSTGES